MPAEAVSNLPPACLTILLEQLLSVLPAFVPRENIVFEGPTNVPITRGVKITNLKTTPATYSVKIKGCKDYSADVEQAFEVPPESSYTLTVTLLPRFSIEMTAILYLLPVSKHAEPLVFALSSKIACKKV